MKIEGQILGGTLPDSQGESISVETFRRLIEASTQRMPLGFQHDPTKGAVGYVENMRLIQNPKNSIEYLLIGDVSIDDEFKDQTTEIIGGFSWSMIEPIPEYERDAPDLSIFFSYPEYNNIEEIIQKYFPDSSNITFGKWIKKEASPDLTAAIWIGAGFLLKPVWDVIFKDEVYPRIKKYLASIGEIWRERKIHGHFVQTLIGFNEKKTRVHIVPSHKKYAESITSEAIDKGLEISHKRIYEYFKKEKELHITKITLLYNDDSEKYEISRTEYSDGNATYTI